MPGYQTPAGSRQRGRHAGVRRRFDRRRVGGVLLALVTNLGITSVYLQGIDGSEIIRTVHGRQSPTISASAG